MKILIGYMILATIISAICSFGFMVDSDKEEAKKFFLCMEAFILATIIIMFLLCK